MNLLAHAGFSDGGSLDGWGLLLFPPILALLVSAVLLLAVFAYFTFCFIREVTRYIAKRRREIAARRGFEIRPARVTLADANPKAAS